MNPRREPRDGATPLGARLREREPGALAPDEPLADDGTGTRAGGRAGPGRGPRSASCSARALAPVRGGFSAAAGFPGGTASTAGTSQIDAANNLVTQMMVEVESILAQDINNEAKLAEKVSALFVRRMLFAFKLRVCVAL